MSFTIKNKLTIQNALTKSRDVIQAVSDPFFKYVIALIKGTSPYQQTNFQHSKKSKGYIMSNTELNKVIRDMQNASLASAKQSPLFNQQAANVVQQGVADKKANPTQPTIKLFTK